ncbi:hypothetical protein F4808DRAFT_469593 [Astrocystis sublimbata]|nr:hypothetical protein F4808DRAFT_469593 [Astrocystis sublimbata]
MGSQISAHVPNQIVKHASDPKEPSTSTGLPTSEIAAIRQLFGYANAVPPQYSASGAGFVLPGATLPGSLMKDVLVIGIHVDTFDRSRRLTADSTFLIGASILDTRLLYQLIRGDRDFASRVNAVSYQYVMGDCDSDYFKHVSPNFLPVTSLAEEIARIKTAISERGRDYILVLYGHPHNRKALADLSMELQPLHIINIIGGVEDLLGDIYKTGLEAWLDTFEILFAKLNVAMNTATYIVRALLMIAVADGKALKLEPSTMNLFWTLNDVARRNPEMTEAVRKARHIARQAAREKEKTEKKKRQKRTRQLDPRTQPKKKRQKRTRQLDPRAQPDDENKPLIAYVAWI